MSRILEIRLALAVIGFGVWGYGLVSDRPNVRLVGIALLAVSLVLRFAPKRMQRGSDKTD